jgi:hypothetical protein
MSIERTQALLDEILVHDDPIVRNRLISLCYADIARQLADVTGPRDLNWFVFGAWASGTAGAAIRGEGIPIDFGTTRNVAEGNLAIISDVAPPAIAWLREVQREGAASEEALARALADPSFAQAPKLVQAISCFHAATVLRAEDDPVLDKQAAELMLLANMRMGEHEQALVDRFIDRAMPLGGPFGLITTKFISIETPDGEIDVSRDVLAPSYLSEGVFPSVLVQLDHPDLVAACRALDQSAGIDVSHSNALRWEDFDDRMGFILTFFRAYQRDERFFDIPARYFPEDRLTT